MLKNLKELIKHLSDGKFHSGAELGKKLGITRSAIWKLTNQFCDLGIEIESVTGKGYRIPDGLDLLNLHKIKKNIDKQNLKVLNKIEIFDEIGSTQTYLMDLIGSHKDGVRVCLAESQSGGKGRLGRSWKSPFGANIYLSMLYPFSKDISELAGLSLVVATIVADVLSDIGIKKDIGLKWPNDILWKRRKLGGILIEISGETHGSNYAVIGIGINVNMPKSISESIDQPVVDIREIKPEVADRNKIIGFLINKLIEKIQVFEKLGFVSFYEHFRELDVLAGSPVTIITQIGKMSGIAKGFDEKGRFILEDSSKNLHIFSSGDITICK